MTNNDRVDFYLALDTVAEVFNVELSATRKRAYFAALEDVPWDAIEVAFRDAIRLEQFFPVPATLRELAGYITERLPAAEAAWNRLRDIEKRYNRDALNDPITREVFEAMGGGYVLEWGFGNWDLVLEDRKRKEFLGRYRELQQARAIEAAQPERAAIMQQQMPLVAGPEETA